MDILEAKFNSIKKSRKQKLKGFTLIEIVAVITLLMLMVSMALPKYTEIVDKQRLKLDASTAVQLSNIAETWYMENKTLKDFDVSNLTNYIKSVYGGVEPTSQYLKGKNFAVTIDNGKATVKLENIEFVKDGIFNEDSVTVVSLD